MAEVLGVDLMAAITRGALAGEDWRDAVLRCTCCDDPDACMQWLAEHTDAVPVTLPAMCRNAALYETLRRQAAQGSEVRGLA